MPTIKYKKKTYAGGSMPVLEMTKAQYEALPAAKQNDGTIYLITDGDGGWEAEDVSYDNTESGLTATNVQDAVDEAYETKTLQTTVHIESTDARLHASCSGKIVHIDLVILPKNDLSVSTKVGSISLPRHLANEIHAACIAQNGTSVRFWCDIYGAIRIETVAPAGNYLSVSLIGILT